MSVCHSCFCAPGYYRAALFLTGRRFRNASGVTDRAEPGAYRTKPGVVISKPGLVNPKPGLVKPKPGLIEARPAFGEGGGGGWNFSGKEHGRLLYIYVFQPLKNIVQTFSKKCFLLIFRRFGHERLFLSAFRKGFAKQISDEKRQRVCHGAAEAAERGMSELKLLPWGNRQG